jgi:creatinine amidohydrolase/Fe(II)-dependent formamide hydrolase-like protein
MSVIALVAMSGAIALSQGSAPRAGQSGAGRIANVNNTERTDVATMPNPIPAHDTVWMEDLTMLEIRDLLKQGKTTALILTGGVEENGPYLTTGKHNNVLRVMGPAIARKLGNALIAPIVPFEPGSPVPAEGRSGLPGSTVISQETFTAILADMANSLRSQGFKNIIMLGDNGGNARGMTAAVKTFNDRWKGAGAMAYTIPEYYSYTEDAAPGFSVQSYEESLGIHEKIGLENGGDGFHDDYYISAFVLLRDPGDARIPERIKAGKTTINSIDLAPGGKLDKTLENARKLVEYRADNTVKAIRKATADK